MGIKLKDKKKNEKSRRGLLLRGDESKNNPIVLSLHSDDHLSFLKALLKFDVKFIIIGGHAAIYYGVHRNTGDLDILIEPTVINGNKVLQALRSLKLEVPEIKPEEFKSKLILSFGLEPDAVDILNYTPGIDFEPVFQNSIEVKFNELKIRMIDVRDLLKNKEALQRTGEKAYLDKYDIKVLKRIIEKKKE